MGIKVRLQLEVFGAPEKLGGSSVDFIKDTELDFLPTVGLGFHLVEIPKWSSCITAEVEYVNVFLTEKPSFVYVTFQPKSWKELVEKEQCQHQWESFKQSFLRDGWDVSQEVE
jgi:hypothetical protein